MIKIFIQHDRSFIKQIEYVFNTIFSILGFRSEFIDSIDGLYMDNADILIIYHKDQLNISNYKFPNIISIKSASKLFGQNYLDESSIPQIIKRFYFNGKYLISVFGDGEPLYAEVKSTECAKIGMTNLDIISDTFFMLTRYEEIVERKVQITDFHNRFPVSESLAFKNSFLNRPVVNEYIEFLWDIIDSFGLGYKKKNIWGDKDFAACISHDVDNVQFYNSIRWMIKFTTKLLIKYKNPKGAIDNIVAFSKTRLDHKRDPAWTFDYITEMEKRLGFESSFYFMSGCKSPEENSYKIDNPIIIKLIQELEEKGCEVGYHGSYNSFNDFYQMNQETKVLDGIVENRSYGCRQHFLRFKAPDTWRHQEKCGLLYDSTLTFAGFEGFRSGICLPYKPFDILGNRVLNIWEIPLIIMDGTLNSYRDLSQDEALAISINLIKTVKQYNGVFTLLWHNSSFNLSWNGWEHVYEGIMNFLHQENCLGISGRTIIDMISEERMTNEFI